MGELTAQHKQFRGRHLAGIFFQIAAWLKSKEGPANIEALTIDFDHEYTDWTVRVFFYGLGREG